LNKQKLVSTCGAANHTGGIFIRNVREKSDKKKREEEVDRE